jgi:hypothetical protein
MHHSIIAIGGGGDNSGNIFDLELLGSNAATYSETALLSSRKSQHQAELLPRGTAQSTVEPHVPRASSHNIKVPLNIS